MVWCFVAGAWLYWLTFFPFVPACDVRYSYFPCAAILFAGVQWATAALAAVRPGGAALAGARPEPTRGGAYSRR
jgi:hypothetical protein